MLSARSELCSGDQQIAFPRQRIVSQQLDEDFEKRASLATQGFQPNQRASSQEANELSNDSLVRQNSSNQGKMREQPNVIGCDSPVQKNGC